MVSIILFLHLLGSIGMGFYLLFPFLLMKKGGEGLAQTIGNFYTANRVGQILLIVQFLTGGYMISKFNNSTAWIIVVILLVVVIGGLTGMLGKKLKTVREALSSGKAAAEAGMGEVQTFSWLIALSFLVMVILMSYPF
ncbi:hypothetical protein [Paenibacillus sp. J2TS4]|uniref:hypothetical protein n=1 Tax=Paenibacillus sp. J2TS4 TaxID=2807194 RepID=UPI001B0C6F94|nr:hypothetical protein [Paenibacillus sp. J2TS4]GIP33708.1 hypothetical protein J2TS4_29180 [Paenibacillus sp. J2TS4]